MQFNPQETRFIERLRKQQQLWPRTRWVLLLMGIASLGVAVLYTYILYVVTCLSLPGQTETGGVIAIAFLVTKCYVMFLFGVWCLVRCWLNWQGDTERALLLKLLDAQSKE